jgi:CHAD domain-containing protein
MTTTGTTHHEVERTFEGHPLRPLDPADLPGVGRVVDAGPEVLDAVYFDTGSLALLGHGMTLRRREGGKDAGWHLKTPEPDGSRTEFQLPLTVESDTPPQDTPPQELLRRVQVYVRGAELRPVAHLRTVRERTLLLDAHGRTLAEVAADRVAARVIEPVPDASAPSAAEPQRELSTWSETEAELVAGGTALLDAITDAFAAQGLLPAAVSSKLARALGARTPAAAFEQLDVQGSGPTAEAFVGALRHRTVQLLALDQAVRADEEDAVHQMRVTARRLRSLFRVQRRLCDRRRTDPLIDELRWFGRVLGACRDPETLGERLVSQAAELPAAADPSATVRRVRAWTDRQHTAARSELLLVMASPRYFALVDALEHASARPPLRPGRHYGPKAARRMLRGESRRVVSGMEAAERQPPGPDRDSALHRTRKAAKRARYGTESLRTVLGGKVERAAASFKDLQQHLGRHQDAVAAEQTLTELARDPATTPAMAFACGILFAGQRHAADVHAARRASRRLRKA